MNVYLAPVTLALLSLTGLMLALLAEGSLEVLSFIALSIPLLVVLISMLRRRPPPNRKSSLHP